MLTTLATAILASDEHDLAPLIAPPLVIGGVAALVFLMLGLVTFAYRDVANRHSHKTANQPNGHDAGH